MNGRLLAGLVLAAVAAVPPVVADTGIYESLDAVQIGRVFLSPAERRWLDARRGSGPLPRPLRPVPVPEEPEPVPEKAVPPAGYFISSSGQARVWENGDFVESGSRRTRDMVFPGEVRVSRHVRDGGGEPDSRGPGDADDPLPRKTDDEAGADVP